MNLQILVSPPARVEPWHKDQRSPGLHADKVTLHGLSRVSTSSLRVDLRPTIRWSGHRPRSTPALLWRMPCGWCQMAMAGRKCTAMAMVCRYGC